MSVPAPLLRSPELRFVRDLLAQGLGYPLRSPEPLPGLDQRQIVFLLEWHGLTPWILHVKPPRLAELSQPAQQTLSQLQLANAARVMGQLVLIRALQERFSEQDIPMLVLKGVGLSLRHYGTAAMRACGDLDLMIPRRHMLRGHAILETMGYVCTLYAPPGVDRLNWVLWHRQELCYAIPKANTSVAATVPREVELHHRPGAYAASLCPPESIYAGAAEVSAGGPSFKVLPEPYQLVALLQHGAASRWHRLKWILDVEQELRLAGTSGHYATKNFATGEFHRLYENFLRVRQHLFDGVTGNHRLNGSIVRGLNSTVEVGPERWQILFLLEFLRHELSLAATWRHKLQIVMRRLARVAETSLQPSPGAGRIWRYLAMPLALLYREFAVRYIARSGMHKSDA